VASALFEALVVPALRYGLPEPLREFFRLNTYDLLLPRYSDVSTIEVISSRLPKGHRYIFHALGTDRGPLDSVEVRRVSADGEPFDTNLEVVPLSDVFLELRVVDPSNGKEVLMTA
jgi:hypothetical protein